jgi:hypothetical protein
VVNLRITRTESEASMKDAVKICLLLLEQGADPTVRAKNVSISKSGNTSVRFDNTTPRKALIGMKDWNYMPRSATILKEYNQVCKVLEREEKFWKWNCNNSVTLPQSVLQTLTKLRQSKDSIDMTFLCKDNVDVLAHSNIVAASSPYFERFFAGPWANEFLDGCWKTEYTSTIINIILDFVYIGKFNNQLLKDNCCLVYAAATEFEFDDLRIVARKYMISGLSSDNNTDLLEIAYLHKDDELTEDCQDYMIENLSSDSILDCLEFVHSHNDEKLINACHEFVMANLNEVILNPSFSRLPFENPELWKKIFTRMIPNGTSWDCDTCTRRKREE